MIWQTIRAAIYIGLGVAEVASDVYAAGRRIVRKLKPTKPEPSDPLTFKDVQHIQAQIKSASRPLTIVPPPKEPKK